MILELIKIRRKSEKPIFQQLVDQIIGLVSQGILVPGSALPGSRKMAVKLGLHRKTVVSAIDELVAQGWLVTQPGKGTYVSDQINVEPVELYENEVDVKRVSHQIEIPEILRRPLHLPKEAYHLDDGLPDPRLAPTDELGRAYRSALKHGIRYAKYSYGDPQGHVLLRESLSKYLSESRGIHVSPGRILITRGVTQALYLTIQAFIRQGDRVAMGTLGWESAKVNFAYHGATLVRINVDQDGFDVDHLEEICKRKTIKMVYVTPHHQYPTTAIMPAHRRIKLLKLAYRFGFLIFEDDYDYDFHFSRYPILPLASARHGPEILYAGSFTKAISPVFRVGYLIGSEDQISLLSKIRRMVDRQGDAMLELALTELLKTGTMQRYLRKNRKIYRSRRDYFVSLISSSLEGLVSYTIPEGGMAVWTRFHHPLDLIDIAKRALSQDLYLQDGAEFNNKPDDVQATRLGFASSTLNELECAVEILSQLVLENLHSGKRTI